MGNISGEEEFYFTFKTSSDLFKNRIICKSTADKAWMFKENTFLSP